MLKNSWKVSSALLSKGKTAQFRVKCLLYGNRMCSGIDTWKFMVYTEEFDNATFNSQHLF